MASHLETTLSFPGFLFYVFFHVLFLMEGAPKKRSIISRIQVLSLGNMFWGVNFARYDVNYVEEERSRFSSALFSFGK